MKDDLHKLMDKIVVLYIIDTFIEMGGAEKNLFQLVTGLNPAKYTPLVICLQGGPLKNILQEAQIEVIDLGIKRIYTPVAFWKAGQIFDLIRKRDVKIVTTYHEGADFWGGLIAKIVGVPIIISSRRDMGYKLKKRHVFFYKLINPIFNKIIAVSDAVKEVIVSRENVSPEIIDVIHNGLNLKLFESKAKRIEVLESLKLNDKILNKNALIGIIANLRPIKGHKFFFEAAALILNIIPDAFFLVVGAYDKKDNYVKELMDLIATLNIEKNIIFTGSRNDMGEILSLVDVCVFSSINEGFSNAVIEAMAAGKPVVATNTGGTPEAVVNNKTGFTVPPCNSGALADAILKLLNNKELATQMGLAAKKRAIELFSEEKMIKNIETLYDCLIKERKEQ